MRGHSHWRRFLFAVLFLGLAVSRAETPYHKAVESFINSKGPFVP
ncbi:MAG: hypothetical protein ABSG67_14090 [Thermoguttaceae bacterium]|jgi:hypothetical protein